MIKFKVVPEQCPTGYTRVMARSHEHAVRVYLSGSTYPIDPGTETFFVTGPDGVERVVRLTVSLEVEPCPEETRMKAVENLVARCEEIEKSDEHPGLKGVRLASFNEEALER